MDWETGQVSDLVLERGRERWEEKELLLRERCMRVDLTAGGDAGVRWGKETAFVNASVMDVEYEPVNAPWLVDVDLAVRSGLEKASAS